MRGARGWFGAVPWSVGGGGGVGEREREERGGGRRRPAAGERRHGTTRVGDALLRLFPARFPPLSLSFRFRIYRHCSDKSGPFTVKMDGSDRVQSLSCSSDCRRSPSRRTYPNGPFSLPRAGGRICPCGVRGYYVDTVSVFACLRVGALVLVRTFASRLLMVKNGQHPFSFGDVNSRCTNLMMKPLIHEVVS